MVGEGGFEPPKALPADLQSVPFGHSGIPLYELFETLSLVYQIKTQRSGFDLKRKKIAERSFRVRAETEHSELLLTMELVDGLEPPTC